MCLLHIYVIEHVQEISNLSIDKITSKIIYKDNNTVITQLKKIY